MADPRRVRQGRQKALRLGLAILGALIALAALGMYLHGVGDARPSAARSLLLLSAAKVDVYAVAWVPLLGALLILGGVGSRLRVAWIGVAIIAVFGAFFFRSIGWGFFVAAAVAALALSAMLPRRRVKAQTP